MKITRTLCQYMYHNSFFQHHLLIIDAGRKTLISAANLFLKVHASNSINTSERYSRALKRFFEFLICEYVIHRENQNLNIWRLATVEDIRNWQNIIVRDRDTINAKKPSDKTIQDNAKIVFMFYNWASENGFPVAIAPSSRAWEFNFRNESKLIKVHSFIKGSSPDYANIDIASKSTTFSSDNKKLYIMSTEDINSLIKSYKDPVYPALLLLALATGMREQGCVSMPYIGTGDNSHIRAYPDIKRELIDESAKTFSFTVIEKGRKQRTLQVNMAVWETICEFYLPFYYERRKKFLVHNPYKNSNEYFFLKKNGEPVTEKNIADQTYLAKKTLTNFPWSFHSTRDWYATNFIIKHLTRNKINTIHYDAAVEEQLRKQLGHNDIKTTYTHYVRQASLILSIENGELDYTLGKSTAFFESILN